jgi:hypothetical protein
MVVRSVILAGLAACLIAGDAEPVKPPAADPTAAIVLTGRQIYRQRDLDALLAIAQRHAGRRYQGQELERVRTAILKLLAARSAVVEATASLPESFPAKGRERLVLDVLDYQGEAAPAGTAADPAPPRADPTPGTAATVAGPVLVRLPPLTLNRTITGARKQLTLSLALYFSDHALARRIEEQAPLLQDAVLGHLQHLPEAQFAEPDQVQLKAGLTAAIIARIPAFPADGLLIPQLETGDGR